MSIPQCRRTRHRSRWQIVRASPGCRRPLFKRSVACVTEGVSVVPVVARLRKEDGWSSLRRGLGQANCGLC